MVLLVGVLHYRPDLLVYFIMESVQQPTQLEEYVIVDGIQYNNIVISNSLLTDILNSLPLKATLQQLVCCLRIFIGFEKALHSIQIRFQSKSFCPHFGRLIFCDSADVER